MPCKTLLGPFNIERVSMNTLIKTIVLTCLIAVPSFAQGNEKAAGDGDAKVAQQLAKAEKVDAFLDEHFPGKRAELASILEKEGRLAHDAEFQHQVGIYDHYQRVLSLGENVADLVIEQNKMYSELQVLLDRFDALDPDDPARVQARAEAEPLLVKANTFSGEWAKQQIISLKRMDPVKYEKQIAIHERKVKAMDALRAQPKKIFDDYIAYREGAIKAAEKSKEKLPANWHTAPKEAVAAAKESGKLIHVFFSATWCGPCQVMVKKVFPNEDVQEALKEFEPLYLDGDVFGSFARKYRVRMYPTSMIMNTEGEVVHRSSANGMSAEEFIEWLKTKK